MLFLNKNYNLKKKHFLYSLLYYFRKANEAAQFTKKLFDRYGDEALK